MNNKIELDTSTASTNLEAFNYFIKGDISGIQEFIFNVKSEGAAKALKGRSFFIQALSLIGIQMLKDAYGEANIKVFYNGGGNFYLFLKEGSEKKLEEVQQQIDRTCHTRDFYLCLSIISVEGKKIRSRFGDYWEKLNDQSQQDKLKKFQYYSKGFLAYLKEDEKKIFDWKGLTNFLKENDKYSIHLEDKDSLKVKVGQLGVRIFGYFLTSGDTAFEHLIKDLPRWTERLIADNQGFIFEELLKKLQKGEKESRPRPGNIMEFSFLSGFAAQRTGTNKLGILKMDVDNLGDLFQQLNYEAAEKVSDTISHFFGDGMNQLLQTKITVPINYKGPTKFIQNIYPVFSGGDDCFYVGGWDAILRWAEVMHKAFSIMAVQLHNTIRTMMKVVPKDFDELSPLTLSGAMVMLDPTYPTTRFSDMAKEALNDAKYFEYTLPNINTRPKNKMNCLGEILQWEEFVETLEKADELKRLVVEEGEPRSTLDKIRSTAHGYQLLYENALEREEGPSVSTLFYAVRNSRNHRALSDQLIQPFAKDLIQTFTNRKESNPLKYPLAARIAEFLTRNTN